MDHVDPWEEGRKFDVWFDVLFACFFRGLRGGAKHMGIELIN